MRIEYALCSNVYRLCSGLHRKTLKSQALLQRAQGGEGLSKLGRDSNFIFKQHVKLLVVSFSTRTAKKKSEIDAQFFLFVAAVMF